MTNQTIIEDGTGIIKIKIYEKAKPFFFVRNSLIDKNYRISTSFEYLNKRLGITINVIRNPSKINFNYCADLYLDKTEINYKQNFDLIKSELFDQNNEHNQINIFIFIIFFNLTCKRVSIHSRHFNIYKHCIKIMITLF